MRTSTTNGRNYDRRSLVERSARYFREGRIFLKITHNSLPLRRSGPLDSGIAAYAPTLWEARFREPVRCSTALWQVSLSRPLLCLVQDAWVCRQLHPNPSAPTEVLGAGTAADERVRIEARQRLRYGLKGDRAPLHVRTTVLYCPGYDTLVEAIGSNFHPAREAAGTVLCFGFEECSFLVAWTPICGA